MSEKKKCAQSRSWVLTIPAEKHDRAAVIAALEPYTYVGQLERGESGYLHWQVLIENPSPVRFLTLKTRLPAAHIEPRQGTVAQAVAYVTKEDTRVADEIPLAKGEIRTSDEKGRRSDVERVRAAILEEGRSVDDVLLNLPEAARMPRYVSELAAARDRQAARGAERDVAVTYVYGEPGAGKTRWVYDTHEDVYRVTNYHHPFDAYDGQQVLVFDEFAGQLDIQMMNNLLDRYPLDLPARYRDRPARYTEAVIVSNLAPWDVYVWEPAVIRRAFARRLGRVLLMEAGGHVQEVNLGSVRSRFGLVNAATPAAALEAVPDVVDGALELAPAADAPELEGEQPPF